MKRIVIVMCLILLCACDKNESNQNEQVQQKVSSTTSQPITEIIETPSINSSTAEQSTTSLAVKEENANVNQDETPSVGQIDHSEFDYSKIDSIGDWKLGTPFSLAKSKLDGMQHAFSKSYDYVSFSSGSYFLTFYNGVLFEITVLDEGKGIADLVVVGDNVASVINKLGAPLAKMDFGNSIDYDYGSYAEPPLSVRIQDDKVIAIRMNKHTEGDQKERDLLSDYLKESAAHSTPEKAPVQQEEPKAITIDEYVKISEDLLNALMQYTQIMSKDIADDEKLKKIEDIDSKYNVYDLSVVFENAVPADDKDSKLHIRCKKFIEKVDSLFGTGMFYLNVKMKEDDEKTVADWQKQASKELQEVWAWVNQR
ncbi:hypothetical protein GCM10023310_53460 [Paenibacillus vulneris]|uniref:Lipoprotein n=1 Tax=Paenibacillus vulneris TaxID=1133364 RepID=A0ABW3UMV6_9BACL